MPIGLRRHYRGQCRVSSDGRVVSVTNPATGEAVTCVAGTSVDGLARGRGRSCRVRQFVSVTPPRERAERLRVAFELMRVERESIATLITAHSPARRAVKCSNSDGGTVEALAAAASPCEMAGEAW